MPRTGLWLRVFVGLLIAVLPPLLLLVATLLFLGDVLPQASPNVVAIVLIVGSIAWAAILAVAFSRSLADDVRHLVSAAQKGRRVEDADVGDAYRDLSRSLEERNRQVAALAEQTSTVGIDDPSQVARRIVAGVRSVLRDPTWSLAVVRSEWPELLPAGVYEGAQDSGGIRQVGDLERWAAVTEVEGPARHVEGPWGAFAVIAVPILDTTTAVLYAPWEGRAELAPADISLLTLVGQHAATALEHALLYARLRAQTDELTRLSAIQTDFLRGVTHDLQTPLTSIAALATELRADAGVPDTARADLDSISHQAERLRRVVSQLLVASRLEAGVITPQQDVFALQPIVERTWKAMRANRHFAVEVRGQPHLAVGDEDRLEQVMWALLDNAMKYSPDGSPIDVVIDAANGSVEVSVTDRGLGMDESTRARAFEQFYRAPQARKQAPDGSGVGLYAARGLIEAMDGSISIQSQVGAGTTVSIRLPAEPVAVGAGDD